MVYLLPLFTVFIWGGNAIVNKMAAATIEPSAMSFYRWFLAILLLSPFCLPKVIKRWATIRPYLAKLAFLAMLGMVVAFLLRRADYNRFKYGNDYLASATDCHFHECASIR